VDIWRGIYGVLRSALCQVLYQRSSGEAQRAGDIKSTVTVIRILARIAKVVGGLQDRRADLGWLAVANLIH